MRHITRVTFLFFLCGLFFPGHSQDVHFTQSSASQFVINPAFTGWFEGDCRATILYREQWRAIDGNPYGTYGVSLEKQHPFYTEQINYGISFLQDKSGDVRLTTNYITLSGSYLKVLDGHTIQIGMHLGIVNNAVNAEDFTFDSQFTLGEEEMFSDDISSGENLEESSFYFNFDAGVLWSKKLADKITPVLGFSVFHINSPNESLYVESESKSKVPIRMVAHGSMIYKISDKLKVIPSVIYMNQQKATELLMGANAEIALESKLFTAVYGGVQFRYGMVDNYDALAGIVGTKFKQFDVGFSYDLNVSQLNVATTNQGAFEISLRYTCKSTSVKKVKVSCERI